MIDPETKEPPDPGSDEEFLGFNNTHQSTQTDRGLTEMDEDDSVGNIHKKIIELQLPNR